MSTTLLRYPKPDPLRCRGWISLLGSQIPCALDAAGVGQCRMCGAQEANASRQRRAREERALTKSLQTKTYGPAPDGVDVFAGLADNGHGSDCDCSGCLPWTY